MGLNSGFKGLMLSSNLMMAAVLAETCSYITSLTPS